MHKPLIIALALSLGGCGQPKPTCPNGMEERDVCHVVKGMENSLDSKFQVLMCGKECVPHE